MRLAEKLAHLREVEGQVRGLGRPLSKAEVARAMRAERGASVSHAYLSQLESGSRIHLSATTRELLAGFYKVHPGYLVDDPPDYQTEIISPSLLGDVDRLRDWLANRAEEQRDDPVVYRFFLRLAAADEPRRYLVFFGELLEHPTGGVERLAAGAARARVEGS